MTENKKDNCAAYFFHQGTDCRAYKYLGAHSENGKFVFRVWAPNADRAYVVGDFNSWNETCPMERVTQGGIWEAYVDAEHIKYGDLYKYKFINGEREIYKADPYGTYCQCPPETASVLYDSSDYIWNDEGWMRHRRESKTDFYSLPMNVYEVHLGSWKRHEDGSYCSYTELADELAPYVKQMGYTHIELMPVMEHPFDGSWGYQVCGYYAPTARYGTPRDFKAFIDRMHGAGIGVILDWVPAHFPKDAHGLYEFDGGLLYEYQGQDRMEHQGWGTRRFDVGREEVQSFLISNAVYWAQEFHADGLRVDAVASMLYLDYDKKPGEWIPNVYGDNRCLEAVSFFQKLNSAMLTQCPDVLMIAEESSAWPHVTGFDDGGLGFSLKWNMGWMNDTLDYAVTDPYFRKYNHNKMTFSLTYAFSEKYVLPISHDEVVHGKKSFLDKMPGDYEQKFASARVFMMYMMAHPGKKLMFMGSEIGQFREWDYKGQIEWFLLDYEKHAKIQLFCSALNHLYLENPAMWQRDNSWDGFRWIDPNDRDRSILSMRRIDNEGNELIFVLNFTPVEREKYRMVVPYAGTYKEIFNSDSTEFGGCGKTNSTELQSEHSEADGLGSEDFITFDLPALSGCVFRCTKKRCRTERRKRSPKAKGNAAIPII